MRTSFFTSIVLLAATSSVFVAATPIPDPYRPYIGSTGSASTGSSGDVSGGNVVNSATGDVNNAAGASTSFLRTDFDLD